MKRAIMIDGRYGRNGRDGQVMRSCVLVGVGLCIGVLSVFVGWCDSVCHWEVPLFVIGAGLDIWGLRGLGL